MAPKPLSPLMAFALILTFSTAFSRMILTSNDALADVDSSALAPDAAEGPTASAGADTGFVQVDTRNPGVIALAKFAIDQYNSRYKSNLVYSALLEAIGIVHAKATQYELVIVATNNGDLHIYTVNLWFDGDEKRLVFLRENE